MKFTKTLAVVSATGLALGLAACSGSDDTATDSSAGESSSGNAIVTAWGSEPQNPLNPQNTNETGGGRIIDSVFAGLVYYDADGKVHNEMAESIEPSEGNKVFTIKIKDGMKFADGTAVDSDSFIDAWNYAVENALLSNYFFEPIEGYNDGGEKLTGLEKVDDLTFKVTLTQPEADFPLRLGYSAFYPLPKVAFEDMDAFGEKPVGNGMYKVSDWQHNKSLKVVPNENYTGVRKVANDGVEFVFYSKPDAAYTALQSGNLDIIDTIPDSALSTFRDELGDRAINQPSAIFQSFTIPEKIEHFNGEEGNLRRQALSMAINRPLICEKIFQDTRTPATDFTSPVIAGHSDSLTGAEVLEYNPDKAKELWAKADAISPWSGEFTIAYNADGGHQGWVDAAANDIKNTLDIDAHGKAYPDFKSLRDEVTNRTITGAFRTGWQADYPALANFLGPLYGTGAGSNDGDYSNEAFDAKLEQGAGASDLDSSIKTYNEAQEILLEDLPAIPLWYSNVTGGYGESVSNVKFGWNSVPLYYMVEKK
ncbi:ABC transporter substrate-binding protein [Corynebacterium mendelii]|uniref:ABC transporter substrate-binding protein n=1 Tax=Corynebacterium mendelii TaxID=2765362 RepID=A0A939E3L9_9CORY|nr:ABC transporter substrate-binding protein [Corynebacterium mendelii]MBN9644822.1 ABC transporter substrate-binding protein [Corynebacterium mendelii]